MILWFLCLNQQPFCYSYTTAEGNVATAFKVPIKKKIALFLNIKLFLDILQIPSHHSYKTLQLYHSWKKHL